MVQQGTAFARVEDAIDATPFSRSHKGALWLLAWSLRDSSQQRRDARLMAGTFAPRSRFGADRSTTHLGTTPTL
jgi:hypothetical protein